jgi:hypothetical protein
MIFRPPTRSRLHAIVMGPLVATAFVLLAPASAQNIVGGTTSPSVIVDQGVLDQLGRTPNVADVLGNGRPDAPATLSPYANNTLQFPVISRRNGTAPSGHIKLRPPTKKKARSTRRKTTRSTPRKTKRRTATRRATTPKLPARTAATRKMSAPSMKATPLQPPPAPKMAAVPNLKPVTSAPAVKSRRSTAPTRPTAPSLPKSAGTLAPRPPAAPDIPIAPKISAPTPRGKSLPATKIARSKTKVASLPSPASRSHQGKLGVGSSVRVGFATGSAKLNSPAEADLKKVADALKADLALRIQLLAYAGGTTNSASQARRLSLSRALAARSSLINQGVKSARIDVRALGNQSEGGPADRIDIIVTKR